MRFEYPAITDHGSIADHTFYRCASGTGVEGVDPPKDTREFLHDNFGECSEGHGS